MTAPVGRLTVIGLGLLGGSVALAARARGAATRVVGVARRREGARRALALGAVDEATDDLGAGVADAELVVVATTLDATPEVVRQAAPRLAPGALVTDVGSVKGRLAETLPGLLPRGAVFVGAHPMAGSHRRGLEHARADLFEGATCVLTPTAETPPEALARVRRFWEALGARVRERDPIQHDLEVGWVSHVPHALAYAFAHRFGDAPEGAGEVQGPGFRDFTRIAWSDPELWAEILTANRKAIVAPLRDVAASVEELARFVESGDAEAVERFLAAARDALARRASGAPERGAAIEIPGAAGAATREGSNEDHS